MAPQQLSSNDTAAGSSSNSSSQGDNNRHKGLLAKNISEEELVRLMVQSLRDLGYSQTSASLQQESGYALETSQVQTFRSAVLAGEWAIVESLLPDLLSISKDQQSPQSPDQTHKEMLFAIREQKYLEALELKNTKRALHILRNELAVLALSSRANRLHELSSFIMCPDLAELKRKAAWDGAGGESRSRLLMKLQKHIPSSVMIPERRLETLIQQALLYQKSKCLYHNPSTNPDTEHLSLYTDHSCDRNQFPNLCGHILREHLDEVWFVAFSHHGRYLASSSKDGSVLIWDVDAGFTVKYRLHGHRDAVAFLSWSPDDTRLISCSSDHSARVWNMDTGEQVLHFSKHTDAVTSAAWFPNGQYFVTGSLDKCIYMVDVHSGDIEFRWNGARVTDLGITPDGHKMVAICHEKKIRIYSLATKDELACIQESDSITSVNLSTDSRFALVNLSSQELHVWDLSDVKLCQKYLGQKQGRFVIRSCFGGNMNDSHTDSQNFVVSGSEDAFVYVWHRFHGQLIERLEGHTACVNSVAWNSKRNLFVSGSDDHTVRVWVAPGYKGKMEPEAVGNGEGDRDEKMKLT